VCLKGQTSNFTCEPVSSTNLAFTCMDYTIKTETPKECQHTYLFNTRASQRLASDQAVFRRTLRLLSAIQVKIALAASATKLTSCQQKVNM